MSEELAPQCLRSWLLGIFEIVVDVAKRFSCAKNAFISVFLISEELAPRSQGVGSLMSEGVAR